MKTIKIKLPKSWNELTNDQLEQMALLFSSGMKGKIFDVNVFKILMGGNSNTVGLVLADVPLSELKMHYDFIYDKNDRTVFIKQLKIAGKEYYSPADRFNNISIEEYSLAEDLHFQWREKRDRTYLEYMAAVLYVPAYGKRPIFEKELLEDMAKPFKDVKIEKLLAMEMAFAGCKNNLVKRFPKVYPPAKNTNAAKKENYGFSKVILQMAGGKFGSHNETKQTNVFTFHEDFQETLKQIENAKRKS